jgi:hypothetical protein
MRNRLDDLRLDVRFGLRQLRRSPLTTAVAVGTLAIGIGMNTAVFTLVNAVLLRRLPYPDSDRLVWIAPHHDLFGQDTFASRADYVIWKQQTHVFDKMAAYGTQDLAMVVGEEATQERVASIGGDFWTITGAEPALGRLLDEGDEGSIVLSHGLFARRFGARPDVIGRIIEVGGTAFTVTAVLPQGFRVTFPQQTAPGDELRDLDAFISLPRGHEVPGRHIVQVSRPTPPWVRVVARMAAGIDVPRARTEMVALHARIAREYPRPLTDLLARLEATPGVEAAGISTSTFNVRLTITGAGRSTPDAEPFVAVRMVSPAYLRAMGVSLVRGRWPSPEEALDVMVVNETFARAAGGDPIGRRIGGSFLSGTVVGVVADFPYGRLDGEPLPELYYPYQRSPGTQSIAVAVRMSEAAVPAVRQLIEGVDRTQPVYQFRGVEEALSESVAPRRFNMFLLEVFAASAVIMALVGTFGVVARSVSRRRRETAVRIAVGARPAAVILMIARQAIAYVLGGVVAGVAVAIAAGRTMRSMLYGVEPSDPATLATVAAGVALAACAACFLPAIKASRVDPAIVLRQE